MKARDFPVGSRVAVRSPKWEYSNGTVVGHGTRYVQVALDRPPTPTSAPMPFYRFPPEHLTFEETR